MESHFSIDSDGNGLFLSVRIQAISHPSEIATAYAVLIRDLIWVTSMARSRLSCQSQ
ncbi:MAG: hypothetical protein QNJ46_04235 [Leptolyngbyaceae cyanobacterium MO_188.B28]|nr:hypothetical protein [Leptolyngbyaceae cyanobacterium MO_188.B28]